MNAGVVDAGHPVPVDAATEQEMNAIKEDKLELIGLELAKTRDLWVAHKIALGVERRWTEDTEQYLGIDSATKQAGNMMENVKNGGPKAQNAVVQRSTVFVNITRPKTNAVEARIANMLFPNDDKAWGIKSTPSPTLLMQAMKEAMETAPEPAVAGPAAAPAAAGMEAMTQGTPVQTPDVAGGMQPAAQMQTDMQAPAMGNAAPAATKPTPAQQEIELAKMKAAAMEKEIEDALVECDYNAEGRKMLHNVAMLGTGIMKGPIVVNRVAKVWTKIAGSSKHKLETKTILRPASESVDPWNVYTDPAAGNNIHHGKGIFEKKLVTGKQLRELSDQPAYNPKQIAKALRLAPKRSTSQSEKDRRFEQHHHNEDLFELWEYWGEFDAEMLRVVGVDVPDETVGSVSGCIIMVNDIIIKGFLNPLECGSLPYDFMVLEQDEVSPWGYGIPFLCRPAQRVLNAAWRQMMDNAGMSTGPNVILKPSMVSPADGNWTVTGRKIWNCMDDSIDVREAFFMFDIPNNSKEFQMIIELALRFADEETSVPKIAEGGGQSDSVGVTTIQMNSSNVVLGRLVKQFDDSVTKPQIRRYYDFFMAYSEKDEIKGDYQVDARGSSVLLVRDQQMQTLLQFGQFQGSPVIGPMVRWENWIKELMKGQSIDVGSLLKPDEEIKKILNTPPAPPPEVLKGETAVKVAEIRAQATLDSSAQREQAELAFAQAQTQMARDNAVAKLKELEMKRDMEMLKYANEQKLSLEQVKAQLAQTAMIEETKRQIASAKLAQESLESDKERLTSQSTTQPA